MGEIAGLIVATVGYLSGAVPWGVVLGRTLRGTDLRDQGSGSTGTTNALRAYGVKISVAVLLMDVVKGAAPVLLARWLDVSWWWVALTAVAAVVGHCWSPFIRFDGGKGVATGYGVAIALNPWFALMILLMAAIVALTRYVSLGSIITAGMLAVIAAFAALVDAERWQVAAALVVISVLIIYRHRENIGRLRAGNERTISFRTQRAS